MAIRKREPMRSWSVVEAKAHLDDLIDQAEDDGPQVLERHHDDLGVLVSPDGWRGDEDSQRAKVMEGSLVDFFRRSPLVGSDLDLLWGPDDSDDVRSYDIFTDDTVEIVDPDGSITASERTPELPE